MMKSSWYLQIKKEQSLNMLQESGKSGNAISRKILKSLTKSRIKINDEDERPETYLPVNFVQDIK